MNTISLINKKITWTKITVLADAKKYVNKQKWKVNSPSAYNASIRNGWIKEASEHMVRPIQHNKKWIKETVINEANKYFSKIEWQAKSAGSYLAAHRNGWIKEASEHMKLVRKSNNGEGQILEIVRKHYSSAKSVRIKNNDNKYSFKRLEIDIFIPELKKGIEFDGTYWHSTKMLRKNRSNWKKEEIENYHNIKDQFFKEKGIEIMHIAENTWKYKKEECIQAILSYIGVLL